MARNTNSMWLSFDTGFAPGWTLHWTMTALAITALCRETKCKACRADHSPQELPIDGNPKWIWVAILDSKVLCSSMTKFICSHDQAAAASQP